VSDHKLSLTPWSCIINSELLVELERKKANEQLGGKTHRYLNEYEPATLFLPKGLFYTLRISPTIAAQITLPYEL